ncbi:RND family efflux transporter, MFP subunit [Pleomorphomonas diazotrophica]|uniref:efflux RND transporter periplasmic adaptor subunit n=1 Tax=Pleomorphomonas diazotrophica TaxID=1166257 RepID=UPI0008F24FF2|nr:efflux RND transporter periplasmic adaptor subunit [Pleomorphomonas diazotrophica]SFM52743.1 RND family efflux transporter, MFP subunit [Pleomorphomonas diazotrophica]
MKLLLPLIAVCCLALSPALADAPTEAGSRPVTVRVVTARPAPYAETLVLTGEIQARVSSQLSFRLSGRIAERFADVGDHVTAGSLLARLDPSQQAADVANAEAALAAAEAGARQAASAFDRQKALLDKGFTTQSAFDAALRAVRTTGGTVESAKAALDIARSNLSYTELRADADGIVTTRKGDVGEIAAAARPIFIVAADGPRDAVFDVYEQLFLSIPELPDVAVSLVKDPSVTASGRVREISPTVAAQTGTVRVKVDIGVPPAAMNLGAPVTGHIEGRQTSAVVLPASALTDRNSAPAVWVLDTNGAGAELRPIGIAAYTTDGIVIDAGLRDGDRVVIDGGKLLRPGAAVEIVGGDAP